MSLQSNLGPEGYMLPWNFSVSSCGHFKKYMVTRGILGGADPAPFLGHFGVRLTDFKGNREFLRRDFPAIFIY